MCTFLDDQRKGSDTAVEEGETGRRSHSYDSQPPETRAVISPPFSSLFASSPTSRFLRLFPVPAPLALLHESNTLTLIFLLRGQVLQASVNLLCCYDSRTKLSFLPKKLLVRLERLHFLIVQRIDRTR